MRNRVPQQFGPPEPSGSPGIWTLLLLLALIGLGVLLFLQMRKNGTPLFARPRPVAPSGEPIDAGAILKMRYSRGEIGRDEYLRIVSDIRVGPVVGPEPAAEAPPVEEKAAESKDEPQ